jgi:hypothetical protein
MFRLEYQAAYSDKPYTILVGSKEELKARWREMRTTWRQTLRAGFQRLRKHPNDYRAWELVRTYYAPYRTLRIVPMEWREREEHRINTGVYDPPVWANETMWKENAEIHKDHFVHISTEDPTMLAFTQSPEKGERDIQTRMKPGRYLHRYFGNILTAQQIAFYAEWWVKKYRPAHSNLRLQFSTSPDHVVDIYERGPSSCMKGMDCVRIYHGPDLMVAYVERDGDVMARALVWPDKKVIGRTYPTPGCYDEGDDDDLYESEEDLEGWRQALIGLLRAEGYKTHDEGGRFEGARLRRVPDGDYSDNYLMPYLDLDYGVDDHGDYFVMARSPEYECSGTSGHLVISEPEDEDEVECPVCHTWVPEEDLDHDVITGVTPSEEPIITSRVCSDCSHHVGRGRVPCQISGEYIVDDGHTRPLPILEGGFVHPDYAETSKLYFDDLDNGLRLTEDQPPITLPDGRVTYADNPTIQEREAA